MVVYQNQGKWYPDSSEEKQGNVVVVTASNKRDPVPGVAEAPVYLLQRCQLAAAVYVLEIR